MHLPRSAAPVPGRGGALPVPPGRVVGAVVERVPAQRRPALPGRGQPPRVRHRGVRLAGPARRPRQGRRADPRRPAGRRRAAAGRRGHRRRHLPVQEQHRLRGQLLRLPRELPGRPGRGVLPDRRRPAALPRHPPADLRRRQGAADPARRRVLPVPARRAHLGGRLQRHHPLAADHQHPRRAARRRRALPPAARHRRRLEHVRGDHPAQGGVGAPGAGDDRGGRAVPRLHPRQPDPGHPRDQPRPHRPAHRPAGRRPRGQRAGHPARVPHPGRRARRRARVRAAGPRRSRACWSCGAARSTPSRARTCR